MITQKHTLIMSATLTYPPGGTFFDTIKLSFADVPVDRSSGNAIPTTEFLEAAESLTSLFGTTRCLWLSRAVTNHVQTDVLGSVAFTPVKSDMTGNIKVDPSSPNTSMCSLLIPWNCTENSRQTISGTRRVRNSPISCYKRD